MNVKIILFLIWSLIIPSIAFAQSEKVSFRSSSIGGALSMAGQINPNAYDAIISPNYGYFFKPQLMNGFSLTLYRYGRTSYNTYGTFFREYMKMNMLEFHNTGLMFEEGIYYQRYNQRRSRNNSITLNIRPGAYLALTGHVTLELFFPGLSFRENRNILSYSLNIGSLQFGVRYFFTAKPVAK